MNKNILTPSPHKLKKIVSYTFYLVSQTFDLVSHEFDLP